MVNFFFFFFQAEDGIRDLYVTGVQTCALPIYRAARHGALELNDRGPIAWSVAVGARYPGGDALNAPRDRAAVHGGSRRGDPRERPACRARRVRRAVRRAD